MKITVYTITDCKFSAQEKDYLKASNLAFEEKNLETNKDYLTEMLNMSNNFAGTPVTVIEKDDGQKVVLKGFTKEEFDKELNLGSNAAAPATTGEEAKAPEVSAAAPATPEPAPVVPPAAPTPPVPPAPIIPEAPAPTMPSIPSIPPASEPSMPPSGITPPVGEPMAPTTPSIDETPVAPPAPIMPEAPAPAVPPSPVPPTEPSAPPVVPTGTPAPAAAAPAANDDALNAILNNLQEKVNQDAPKPPTQ